MAEKKSKGKLIIILIVVIIILAAAGGGAFMYLKKQAHPADGAVAATEPAKPAPLPIFYDIEPLTINLQSDDPEADHVLYVGITLEFPDENIRKNFNTYLPKVKTSLILLISSKNIEELRTLDGKLNLSNEIKAVLKPPFAPGLAENSINEVSFTTFILR